RRGGRGGGARGLVRRRASGGAHQAHPHRQRQLLSLAGVPRVLRGPGDPAPAHPPLHPAHERQSRALHQDTAGAVGVPAPVPLYRGAPGCPSRLPRGLPSPPHRYARRPYPDVSLPRACRCQRSIWESQLAEAPSFPDRARTFVFDRFALEPVAASIAGVHEHDHRLGGLTAQSFAGRDAFVDTSLAAFEGFDENALSREERTDRALILAELRGERALRPFQRWRRQPTLYSDLITRGAYYAFLRDHAPLADRVAALAERLGEAPAAIDAAIANLDPALVPAEWVDLALRTVPAGAALLRDGANDLLPSGTPRARAVRRSLGPAARASAAALDRYAEWLERELRPTARGTFAIGRDAVDAARKEQG